MRVNERERESERKKEIERVKEKDSIEGSNEKKRQNERERRRRRRRRREMSVHFATNTLFDWCLIHLIYLCLRIVQAGSFKCIAVD